MVNKNKFEKLEKIIDTTFNDKELLRRAFIHRSFLNESKNDLVSNERLEFLGDAILSFITSEYIFQKYTKYPEGMLTNIRSSVVNTSSLAAAAKKLKLGDYLFLSRGEIEGGGRANDSLLADCFEALLGAMYLDQGLQVSRKFLQTYLFPKISEIINNKTYIDFKSKFQEIIQEKFRVSPTYTVVKTEGKDHDKTFYIEAMIDGKSVAKGKGRSKQAAETAAARAALEKYDNI